jgi:hypothetical protein
VREEEERKRGEGIVGDQARIRKRITKEERGEGKDV